MNKILKISLLGGLFGASACLLYFYILLQLGFNPFGKNKYFYIAIYAFAFIISFKYYRDKINSYRLSAQQAIALGFIINITATVFIFLGTYIFLEFIDSNGSLMTIYIRESLELLNHTKDYTIKELGRSKFDQVYNSIKHISNLNLAFDTAFGLFLSGGVHTFLFMLIFKNTKK